MEVVYTQKAQCCGCRACEQVCPTSAIQMCADDDGFLYPQVDAAKCVDCLKCQKACAFIKPGKHQHPQVAYAAKYEQRDARMQSQSGGAFSAVATRMLQRGAAVYGAAIGPGFKVTQTRVLDAEGLEALKLSKYVQSDTQDTFAKTKRDLDAGKEVFYSGTPCQIDGLKSFLEKSGANAAKLITADLVCHGVPSPLVYEAYLHLRQTGGRKLCRFVFRDKTKGWHSNVEAYAFADSPQKMHRSNVYMRLFHNRITLRPSCFACPYADCRRAGDITLADFWGIERLFPGDWDESGVSAVITNTPQGEAAFAQLPDMLVYPSTVEAVAAAQPAMAAPGAKPDRYNEFWQTFHSKGPVRAIRKYGGYTFLNRVRTKMRLYVPPLRRILPK